MDEADVADGVLSGQLGDLVRALQAGTDPSAMLGEVVAAAVRMVPGAQEATVSIVSAHRHMTTVVRSVARDQRNYALGEILAHEIADAGVARLKRQYSIPLFNGRPCRNGKLSP